MNAAAVRIALLAAAAVGLAACSGGRGPDHALSCMFEIDPPGQYEYPAGISAPTVTPGAGGTTKGAQDLNACIRRKASATGSSARNQQRATVETESASGGDYTVSTFTYGTLPAAASPGRKGGLQLPSAYALMPGDTQLWSQMTEAQQQRALQFLKGGSTIRSSLSGDQ